MQEKKLGQSQIATGTRTTLYTLGADTTAIVKTIIITNTTAIDTAISIWDIPNGGSFGDGNAIIKDLNVPANDFVQIITYLPLATAGDSIQAEAGTTTSITISLYGAEI